MNKKNILSVALVTGILLTSCGRDDNSVTTTPNANPQETPNTPEKPTTPTTERPSDTNIGLRGYAQDWKVGAEVYLERIDIADLYNNSANVAPLLKELVTFAATEVGGGKYYTLKDEDLKDLRIEDLKYDGSFITFRTVYKNTKSSIQSKLNYSARDFYNRKITINNTYVSSKYMRGNYETPFIGSVFSYDESRYQIDLVNNGKGKSDYNNSLSFTVEVTDKRVDKNRVITEITKEVAGFKTLQQLANDIFIAHQAKFREDARAKIEKKPNQVDFTNELKNIFVNNTYQYITLMLNSDRTKTGDLLWESENILIGGQGHSDIYLECPRFILTSAVIKGNDLHIKIEFQQANEVSINKEYDVVIRNIK